MFKTFISYATEDFEQVSAIRERLEAAGFSTWMDKKSILPGQNWEYEITKALKTCNVVLVFLSTNSFQKRGYVQREIALALDNLREKLEDDIYLIAIKLESIEVPDRLRIRHWLDWRAADAWHKLTAALMAAATQQQVDLSIGQAHGPFNIFPRSHSEKSDGFPGYEVEIAFPEFHSATLPEICEQLNAIFAGEAVSRLLQERTALDSQNYDLFKDNHHTRSNGYWRSFHIATCSHRAISIALQVSWYGAGAAHPNHHFEVKNFLLEPKVRYVFLANFFRDPATGEQRISDICQRELRNQLLKRTGEAWGDTAWLESGTKPLQGNFDAFTFDPNGFKFHFAPYQVSAYALGFWIVEASFEELADILLLDGPVAAVRSSIKDECG
jgi:hypothetical protein